MTDLVKAFEELTTQIKEYEASKIRLTEREDNLKITISTIHKEIQELGISPELLVTKIAELEKQTAEAIALLKKKMETHEEIEEVKEPAIISEEISELSSEEIPAEVVDTVESPVTETVEALKVEVAEEKKELAEAVVDRTLQMFDTNAIVHPSEKEFSKEEILESALENIPNKFEVEKKVQSIDLDDLLN